MVSRWIVDDGMDGRRSDLIDVPRRSGLVGEGASSKGRQAWSPGSLRWSPGSLKWSPGPVARPLATVARPQATAKTLSLGSQN